MKNVKDVFTSGIIMIIATVFVLLAAYIISEYRIKKPEIIIQGENIPSSPQVQQEGLIEIKKVEN